MALQTDYSYDAVGNRLTRDVGGTLETYAYDAFSNRLDTVTAGPVLRTLGYSDSGNTASDDRGGMVLTNIYDSADRLVEVQQGAATVATYLHNAQGQRVAKTAGGATTHYLYDLSGNLIAEADGVTGVASAEYAWLEGMPLAFIQGGAAYFVHADHLNTPQRITDAAGAPVWDAAYRPFGEATVTGLLTFNLRFPGQYYDVETALHYNYFRDYDPTTGRYIQSDPIGLGGGWNTYAYVGGNPQSYADPLGWHKNDKWYGYNNREFQRWFHRCWKQPGDPDANKEEIAEAYQEWVRSGAPTGGNCGGSAPVPVPENVPEDAPDNACGGSCTDEATAVVVAGGVVYIIYRCIRMIPSLYPPLWPTIPANAAAP